MKLQLVNINFNSLPLFAKNVILYADFNVINLLYENEIEPNEAILIYPDSTAVYLMLKFYYGFNITKLISTDLHDELLRRSVELKLNLFFFGDEDNVLNKMKEQLKVVYPDIRLAGIHQGYQFSDEQLIEEINKSNAHILFVGLGAGRQEKWINNNFNKLNPKLIISVGGWFQYLAGRKKRAPEIVRKIHLEWLHKLIFEFHRIWSRYLIGIPLFVFRILTKKIELKINQ
jgi:N-acetylglucosaminyldiphosphoundecaprenol N-acetyl-beta-D-mannosaminyltransferase